MTRTSPSRRSTRPSAPVDKPRASPPGSRSRRATRGKADAALDADIRPSAEQVILRAAGEILDESGYDGLGTTAVARRAHISTGTLYQHYPDKQAILRALVEHLQAERTAIAESAFNRITAGTDWRIPMRESLMMAYRSRLEQPGGRTARRALQSSRELWEWDHRETETLARALARAMRRHNPSLGAQVARRVALVTVASGMAMLDLASLDEKRGKWIIEQALAMREAYLAPYLDL
jgi:AcrR family transcriptional regulator